LSIQTVEIPYVHAKAELCSKPVTDNGQQIVHFQGTPYVMVGIYFAHAHGNGSNGTRNGNRELYYILRPTGRDGEMRRLD
jgi:hypothetical protein